MRHRDDIDTNEAVRLFLRGVSMREIARRMKTGHSTIRGRLDVAGIAKPTNPPDKNGEQWRSIEYDRYEVSDYGRVRRKYSHRRRGYPPILRTNRVHGYPYVCLSVYGKETTWPVHALVAAAFIGSRPRGAHVNHIDGIKTNNRIANLEYVTPKENAQHASRLGLLATGKNNGAYTKPHRRRKGEKNGQAKLTRRQVKRIKERLARGDGQAAIARDYPVTRHTIYLIAHGKKWAHVEV